MSETTVTDETTPADLRKLYEKTKAALDEMTAKVTAFEKEKQTQSVAALIKKAKIDPAVAKFYTGDGSEADVSKWLEENKAIFPADKTENSSTDSEETTTPVVDSNTEAARLLAEATAAVGTEQGLTVTNGRVVGDPDAIARIMKNTPRTPEGYQKLVSMGIMPADPNRV